MSVGLFYKLFPPPRLLEMRATGLDISDRSIKYCDLAPNGDYFRLKRFGEVVLPVGVVEAGQIKNKVALSASLATLKKEQGLNYVMVALPEEQAYIVKLSLPPMPHKEIRQSIELQLEEYVPLPADRLFFDYEIVHSNKVTTNGYEVIVSVFPRATVLDYLEVMNNAGLVPTALEIEAQAVARALTDRSDQETCLVVDFGKTRTGIFVVSGGRVWATSTLATIGGELITTAIQKNLGLEYAAAEELKIKQGLLQIPGDNKLLFALMPIVSVLRDEINKFRGYWESHNDSATVRSISKLILCGGQATLPGLAEHLNESLGLVVETGNVWTNVLDSTTTVPPINYNDSLKYTTALGLALRNFSHL